MTTRQTRRGSWRLAIVGSCSAVASLLAAPAWADGELDPAFGTHGAVKIAFPNSSGGSLREIAVVNGVLEAAGFEPGCTTPFPNLFIVKLSLNGTVVGSPGSVPQQAIRCPATLIVDSATGDIWVASDFSTNGPTSHDTAVARFDAAGSVIATYSVAGDHYGGPFCQAARVILDNQGRFVAPCGVRGEFGVVKIAALRLQAVNDQFAGGLLSSYLSGYRVYGTVIAQDANSGAYYLSGAACRASDTSCPVSATTVKTPVVSRLNADNGALDTGYGSNGAAAVFAVADGQVNGIAIDASGNVLIGGVYGSTSSGYVARLDPTGMPDATFGASGVVLSSDDGIVDVHTDSSNRVYALSAAQLVRFNVNGTPDAGFASSSSVQTLNGPGSRWQSIRFVDGSPSGVYLLGGAGGCPTGCGNAATTAVIAKVTLAGNGGPPPTTTVLAASATTITLGQSVSFTATVTGASPTGSVTFSDGSMSLGSVSLSSGRTTYSTSTLTVGSHSISAAYSGDGRNAASISAALAEVVNAEPVTTPGKTTGGGGSLAFVDLCGMLLMGLCRALRRLPFKTVERWVRQSRIALHSVPAGAFSSRAAGIKTALGNASGPRGGQLLGVKIVAIPAADRRQNIEQPDRTIPQFGFFPLDI